MRTSSYSLIFIICTLFVCTTILCNYIVIYRHYTNQLQQQQQQQQQQNVANRRRQQQDLQNQQQLDLQNRQQQQQQQQQQQRQLEQQRLLEQQLQELREQNRRLQQQQQQQLLQQQKSINSEDEKVLKCQNVYRNYHRNATRGITYEDYINSRVNYGNQRRLRIFVTELQQQQQQQQEQYAMNVVVCGGSISLGHGLLSPTLRYANRLEHWMNTYFPINRTKNSRSSTNNNNNNSTNTTTTNTMNQKQQQQQLKHQVHLRGGHGTDICAMAKRIHQMELPPNPDLIILEFAVNDYQGQDQKVHIDHKTDIFFDGYQQIAICTEAVVHTIISNYPNTAIVFLEFRTGVLNRKTAQLLHTGVAQHYQIPVISYGDAIFPHYYNLVQKLDPNTKYTVPVGETLQPYPYGCADCQLQYIEEPFVFHGCQSSVCNLMFYSGQDHLDCTNSTPLPPNRTHCYVPYFAHDEIHPSAVGHDIAKDFIVEVLARTAQDMCLLEEQQQQQSTSNNNTVITAGTSAINTTRREQQIITKDKGRNKYSSEIQYLPSEYGFLASVADIQRYTNFVMVNDTMHMFGTRQDLIPTKQSSGFRLYGDGAGSRRGWICTNTTGGEYIEFDIQLQPPSCYVVYLTILKSYENMGNITVELYNRRTNTTRTKFIQGIWSPRISIPVDTALNTDNDRTACTGSCSVKIITHPGGQQKQQQQPSNNTTTTTTTTMKGKRRGVVDDGGNKVKIMSLSVRKCLPPSSLSSSNQPKFITKKGVSWFAV